MCIWKRIKIHASDYLTRIRICLFTLKRIRILIKVMRICDHWSKDPPGLYFEPLHLHCKIPRPFIALIWASNAPEFWLQCKSGSRIHFSLFLKKCGSKRIRTRNPVLSYFRIYVHHIHLYEYTLIWLPNYSIIKSRTYALKVLQFLNIFRLVLLFSFFEDSVLAIFYFLCLLENRRVT